jgi:hypothetical protein
MATFEEPDPFQGRGRGRDSEKGWQIDEKGRKYRPTMGGTVREYENRTDRDAALDESYRLSPSVQALIGERVDSVPAAIMGAAVALAELYWNEVGTWTGDPGTIMDRWFAKHFGRRLEPGLRGVMAYEIRRRLARDEGGHTGPSVGPFATYAEQKRWEAATASVPSDRPSFDRVTAIAEAAGAKLGPGPRPFPKPPHVERTANRLRQEARDAEKSPISNPGAPQGHSGEHHWSAKDWNAPIEDTEERREELRRQAAEIVK